ncbi:MAG: DUF2207 domain-containing protein [Clostridia bacterium]
MKNISKVVISLILSFVLSSSIFAGSVDYNIDSYKIEANVKDNGNIDITEYIKYSFDKDMNGIFRNILYKYNFKDQRDNMEATSSRYQASDISNIEVYTSDTSFR